MKNLFIALLAAISLLVTGMTVCEGQQFPTAFRKISNLTDNNLQPPVNAGASFGIESSAIGDLDDDGVVDLAVGATNQFGTWIGAAYILFMNADGSIKSSKMLQCAEPANEQDSFGSSFCALGDLDDDGVEDIGVGAGYDSDGDFQEGAIWILFMKKDGSVKAQQKISSLQGGFTAPLGERYVFGTGSTAVGDLDGDGNIEIAVGARYSGIVYILFLNNNGTVKKYGTISAADGLQIDMNEGLFGYKVAGLGDVDGDGIPDVAIGGHRSDITAVDSGVIYIVFLNAQGGAKSFQMIAPGSPGPGDFSDPAARLLGVGLVGVGDYDGDNVPDLVSGGMDDSNNTGAIWYVMLKSDGKVKSLHKVNKTSSTDLQLNPGDFFGGSISYLGDINNDGVRDLAIGAFLDDDSGPNAGAIWLTTPPCASSDAGTDQNVCSIMPSITMNALPVSGGQGTWSVTAGSGHFSDVHDPTAKVTQLGIGENQFKWTVQTLCGTSSDLVKIIVDAVVKPNAGIDQLQCSAPSAINLTGNNPKNTQALWTIIDGEATITDSNQPQTTATNLSLGLHTFVLSFLENDYCPLMTDTVNISTGTLPVANAGEDQRICDRSPGVTLFADKIPGVAGQWSLYTGQGTILDASAPRTVVLDLKLGTNLFVWSLPGNGTCPAQSDTVAVIVDKTEEPDAGPDQLVCEGTLALYLKANSALYRTGRWSLVSGNGSVVDESSSQTVFLNPGLGINRLIWTFIESNYCPAMSDTVLIAVQNRPQAFTAMPDTTYICTSEAVIAAKESNGLGEWSVTKGPGNIANPAEATTTISLDEMDKPVQVTWTVTAEGCPSSSASAVIVPLSFSIDKIPNVITPNNDGKNDHWKIANIQHVANQVRVYNRWGEEVLNTSGYRNNWTGGSLAPGSYFFFVNLPGCEKEFKGWLNIVD